jgi:hypothetical protein
MGVYHGAMKAEMKISYEETKAHQESMEAMMKVGREQMTAEMKSNKKKKKLDAKMDSHQEEMKVTMEVCLTKSKSNQEYLEANQRRIDTLAGLPSRGNEGQDGGLSNKVEVQSGRFGGQSKKDRYRSGAT